MDDAATTGRCDIQGARVTHPGTADDDDGRHERGIGLASVAVDGGWRWEGEVAAQLACRVGGGEYHLCLVAGHIVCFDGARHVVRSEVSRKS